MRALVLPKLCYLLITHLSGWNGRRYFSRLSPCFADTKKAKRLPETQVLTKDFTTYKIRYVFKKKKVTQLDKSINYWEIAAIHSQINVIKFVESNKFDNVHSKIFVWSIFKKIGRVLIHQICLMKNIQSKF